MHFVTSVCVKRYVYRTYVTKLYFELAKLQIVPNMRWSRTYLWSRTSDASELSYFDFSYFELSQIFVEFFRGKVRESNFGWTHNQTRCTVNCMFTFALIYFVQNTSRKISQIEFFITVIFFHVIVDPNPPFSFLSKITNFFTFIFQLATIDFLRFLIQKHNVKS